MEKAILSKEIKSIASKIGFHKCGITGTHKLEEEGKILSSWLQSGYHAEMTYMERNFEKRVHPALLVEGALSVVVVLYPYFQSTPFWENNTKISIYALGKDYHDVLKAKLWVLLKEIQKLEPKAEGRFFVDSAPVMEKVLAQKCGLGWIGKNSCLITHKGSFFFIGVLFLNLDLEVDLPSNSFCGRCNRCIEACPTKAIVSPGILDARKCISYLTIEKKGKIQAEHRNAIKESGYIFGCDICQIVCPYNKKSVSTQDPEFLNLNSICQSISSKEVLYSSEFKSMSRNTAFSRIPLEKLLDNMDEDESSA